MIMFYKYLFIFTQHIVLFWYSTLCWHRSRLDTFVGFYGHEKIRISWKLGMLYIFSRRFVFYFFFTGCANCARESLQFMFAQIILILQVYRSCVNNNNKKKTINNKNKIRYASRRVRKMRDQQTQSINVLLRWLYWNYEIMFTLF